MKESKLANAKNHEKKRKKKTKGKLEKKEKLQHLETSADANKEQLQAKSSDGAPAGERHELRESAKTAADRIGSEAQHAWAWTRRAVGKPKVGMTLAGAAALGIGAVWGVTEAVVACAAGFAAYKTMGRRARRRSEQRGEVQGGHDIGAMPAPAFG